MSSDLIYTINTCAVYLWERSIYNPQLCRKQIFNKITHTAHTLTHTHTHNRNKMYLQLSRITKQNNLQNPWMYLPAVYSRCWRHDFRGYARYFFTIFRTDANASAEVLYIGGTLVTSRVDCDYSARATRTFFTQILCTQTSAGRRPVNALTRLVGYVNDVTKSQKMCTLSCIRIRGWT